MAAAITATVTARNTHARHQRNVPAGAFDASGADEIPDDAAGVGDDLGEVAEGGAAADDGGRLRGGNGLKVDGVVHVTTRSHSQPRRAP